MLPRQFQAFVPVAGREHREALVLQVERIDVAAVRSVVDDQHDGAITSNVGRMGGGGVHCSFLGGVLCTCGAIHFGRAARLLADDRILVLAGVHGLGRRDPSGRPGRSRATSRGSLQTGHPS